MKFRIKVKYVDGDRDWWEDYEKDDLTNEDEVWEWALKTLDEFNEWAEDVGRPKRTVIGIEIIDANAQKHHKWERTQWTQHRNINGTSQLYDAVKCARCGITAKRIVGTLMHIKIDSKYRGKCYQRCDTSQEHLANKEK